MPDQFVVPQFIDAEDKIFGPITARQFIIMMVTGVIDFALYRWATFWTFLLIGIPVFAIGSIFAFTRINGQAFHFFVLNLIQTFKRPRLRIWQKEYSNAQLKELLKSDTPLPPKLIPRKAPLSSSRLSELTLVVNTGGVYKPEE